MEKTYSARIADMVRNYLDSDSWKYTFDEEKGVFIFELTLKGRLKMIKYCVDVRSDDFTCYAYSPIGGDKDNGRMMASLAEYFCLANYGLKNGNFELDFRDGEIRYKSYVDCDDTMPSEEVIRKAILVPAMMYDRYSSGILGIIFGGMSASEAYEAIEASEAN